MLMYGLLGAITTTDAASIAAATPGAGFAKAAPSKRRLSTASLARRPTNHSCSDRGPAGVSTIVRSRWSVAGRIRTATPSAAAIRAVTADSGSPARSAFVRTRWSPRSRSPSWNQVSSSPSA